MKESVVLKGYAEDGEIYAVKREYSAGDTTSLIVEVAPIPEVKKIYAEQKSKFGRRKNWGSRIKGVLKDE